MIEITNEQGLKDLFEQKHAVLFFHAPWSQYAVISKQMIEFVETYAKMGQSDVTFFFIEPDEANAPLAGPLVATGVPRAVAFVGNGSLSFFRSGRHIHTMRSVIGEGTWAVQNHIKEIFYKHAA